MKRLDRLLRRVAQLEPQPPCGLEALTDAELDAKLKNLIQRLEERGAKPDFLHQEPSCDGCTGNKRAAWCYSWKGDELLICSPRTEPGA